MELKDDNIRLDKAGFPMVLLNGFYMHWIPVTKIQMEYYLSHTEESTYNDSWYQNVLSFNPRTSPGNISVSNYWEAFVTGIMPADALNYARWCNREAGDNYKLPTAKQWFETYQSLLMVPADRRYIDQILSTPGLKPRVQLLLRNIEYSAKQAEFHLDGPRTLADQMLMRLGVMEFVYRDDARNSYAGYGQTHSGFFPQMEIPREGAPQPLSNSREGAQLRQYGFRLIN